MLPLTEPQATLDRRVAEARFHRLYSEYGREVMAYALRRTVDAEDAADVVSETFLVAWRRAAEVSPGPEACLWLFGVARRTLANQRRGQRRRDRLAQRLRQDLAAASPAFAEPERESEAVRSALERLSPEDREILRLTSWEELAPAQAARVLEISAVAARSRLHRARRRLRRELNQAKEGA